MALDDDQPLSGAQFARWVGADPEKWAGRYLAASEALDLCGVRTDADRLAFATSWFRDAMDAARKTVNVNDWVSVFGRGGTPSDT